MQNSFTKALKGEDHDTVPVWFMRQAGRYLPGYSRIRKGMKFKDMISQPEAVMEITYEPVKTLGVDAAIIFSDILLPLEAMGFEVEFGEGNGPSIINNYSRGHFEGVHEFDEKSYAYPTASVISKLRERYNVPIIGFSGGPLTLLSYILMDHPDRDMLVTKEFMIDHAVEFRDIMKLLSAMVIDYCMMQIKAGADAIQIFDSWSGFLSPYEFKKFDDPYLSDIASEIKEYAPLIYFSTQSSAFIEEMEAPFDFISLDWRIRLSRITNHEENRFGIQGNLDPAVINTSRYLEETREVIKDASKFDRYVFNTGHGILPQTDPKRLRDIVDYVHGI
ncbi:MAG: uroporphyrinogen decarboxylase [Thermoplasmata archaeon]